MLRMFNILNFCVVYVINRSYLSTVIGHLNSFRLSLNYHWAKLLAPISTITSDPLFSKLNYFFLGSEGRAPSKMKFDWSNTFENYDQERQLPSCEIQINILPTGCMFRSLTTQNPRDLDCDISLSLKVKCDGAIGLPIYHVYGFILIFNSNIRPNSAPLRDI